MSGEPVASVAWTPVGGGVMMTDVIGHLSTTALWSPNIPHGAVENLAVPVQAANPGDTVLIGFTKPGNGIFFGGQVTDMHVVLISILNMSGATWTPGEGTIRIDIWKH